MYHIPGYYRHQFEEKDLLGDLNRNIDMDNVMSAFSEMMEYLRGNRSNLNIEVTADGARQEFYTAREKAHLKDVTCHLPQSLSGEADSRSNILYLSNLYFYLL